MLYYSFCMLIESTCCKLATIFVFMFMRDIDLQFFHSFFFFFLVFLVFHGNPGLIE